MGNRHSGVMRGKTGPQGVQGIQGDTGPQGVQGDTGAAGDASYYSADFRFFCSTQSRI